MYYLSIDTSFSAAHFLRGYEGNCSLIHGHNWKIRVTIKTTRLDEVGMGLDFKDIKDLSWQVCGKYDHQCINDIEPFNELNPTAENLAKFFFDEIGKLLPDQIEMHKISLWETENYLVEYTV